MSDRPTPGPGWLRRITGQSQGADYTIARWLFFRALGLVFVIAFASLAVQVQGLIGPDGVLPAHELLDLIGDRFGWDRVLIFPTLFWLGAGAGALTAACWGGVFSGLLLALDVWPRLTLLLCWILYLSLTVVGQDFLSFQWDVLLLETALLALFLVPGHLLPGKRWSPVSPIGLCLLWWLLFRLVFESGVGKLNSGDPTWWNLTAMDYHYWTQPLPTWTAWYAAQQPEWLKRASVFLTLALEIGAPPLIFLGRRLRVIGCVGIVFLQLAIVTTGNYTFFNFLTLALALLLVEDRAWRRVLPARLVARIGTTAEPTSEAPAHPARGRAVAIGGCAAGLFALSTATLVQATLPGTWIPSLLATPLRWAGPFRSINSYGLFRVMTTTRLEIELEGSDDGRDWKVYRFRYKPGDPSRRPGFVEPHQPRLDWQMWFAALSRFENTEWFQAFAYRLLQGSPSVAALLEENPFPDHPPKYLRGRLYRYHFTTPAERRATGAWWTREPAGEYTPLLSLRAPAE